MGTAIYVFPCATNSRFEHCIGTYHLAGLVMRHLQSTQPELGISETDVLCVQV